ncbi:unnamed protein product [Gordionus sp. m RMFG-2023]
MVGIHEYIYWENITVRISIFRGRVDTEGNHIHPGSRPDPRPPQNRQTMELFNGMGHGSELPQPSHSGLSTVLNIQLCFICGARSHLQARCPRGPRHVYTGWNYDRRNLVRSRNDRDNGEQIRGAYSVRTALPAVTGAGGLQTMGGTTKVEQPAALEVERPVAVIGPSQEQAQLSNNVGDLLEEWPIVNLSADDLEQLFREQ